MRVMTPAEIRSLARLFDARAEGRPLAPATPDEAVYARLLERLHAPDVNPSAELRDAHFCPFMLLNGLLHASRLEEESVRPTCRALAIGLDTFADYFARSIDSDALVREERRYFAFLLAQWREIGIGMEGVLPTMKADALGLGTAALVRDVLEGGWPALLESPLFEEERVLAAVLQRRSDGGGRAARPPREEVGPAPRAPILERGAEDLNERSIQDWPGGQSGCLEGTASANAGSSMSPASMRRSVGNRATSTPNRRAPYSCGARQTSASVTWSPTQ